MVTQPGPADAVAVLTTDEQDRYADLAVFAADVHIPLDVPAVLWGRTGGWDRERAARFRDRLSEFGLITARRDGGIVLHTRPRGCTADELAELHAVLLDAHRPQVPVRDGRPDWARLPDGRYLWNWLATHLRGAGLIDELAALLVDPAWLVGRLDRSGPAAARTASPGSGTPAPVPSLHALDGHDGPVNALAIAPDGSWLATAAENGTARIWDPATGAHRHTLDAHIGTVTALAVAPDGSWLVTAGSDGRTRIWDPATGVCRHTRHEHAGPVAALAVAPDGSWLATAGVDGTVRFWDPTTGTGRAALRLGDAPRHLAAVGVDLLVVAGGRGPYFLRLIG